MTNIVTQDQLMLKIDPVMCTVLHCYVSEDMDPEVRKVSEEVLDDHPHSQDDMDRSKEPQHYQIPRIKLRICREWSITKNKT